MKPCVYIFEVELGKTRSSVLDYAFPKLNTRCILKLIEFNNHNNLIRIMFKLLKYDNPLKVSCAPNSILSQQNLKTIISAGGDHVALMTKTGNY